MNMNLNRRNAKGRSARKPRPITSNKAKAARPSAQTAGSKPGRGTRVVKGRPARTPVPANDTVVVAPVKDASELPVEEIEADVTEVAGLAPEVPDIIETDEVTLEAANEIADTDAEEEEDEEEEAEEAPAVEGGRRPVARTTNRPASWRCISATWRSWMSSDPSRNSRRPATSRSSSSICGEPCWASRRVPVGSSTSSSVSSASSSRKPRLIGPALSGRAASRRSPLEPDSRRPALSWPRSCACWTSTVSSSTRR